MKRFRAILMGLTLLSFGATASAGSLIIEPLDKTVNVGDTFDLKVLGKGFAETLVGGGFDLTFDDVVLSLTAVTIDPIWEFVPSGGSIDNTAGTLTDASFNTFASPRSGDFDVATLTFKALTKGISNITLGASALFVFSDVPGNLVTPTFDAARVTVAIPEPSALAMMIAGFAVLAVTLRNRLRAPSCPA